MVIVIPNNNDVGLLKKKIIMMLENLRENVTNMIEMAES